MSELLVDASMLMLIGMVMVFAFLTLLTYCVKLLTHFTADPLASAAPATSTARLSHSGAAPTKAQMAAITTAVTKYRASR